MKRTIKFEECQHCYNTKKKITDYNKIGTTDIIRKIEKCPYCLGKGKIKIIVEDYTNET